MPGGPVTVRRKRYNTKGDLKQFALGIERRIAKSKGSDAMAQLICRLMTGDDIKVAAMMVSKWVEWRYGKVPDTPNITINNQPMLMISGYNDDRINQLKQINVISQGSEDTSTDSEAIDTIIESSDMMNTST